MQYVDHKISVIFLSKRLGHKNCDAAATIYDIHSPIS